MDWSAVLKQPETRAAFDEWFSRERQSAVERLVYSDEDFASIVRHQQRVRALDMLRAEVTAEERELAQHAGYEQRAGIRRAG